MLSVFLKNKVTPQEFKELKKEFLSYSFFTDIEESQWSQVEILYGDTLSETELDEARRLRWVHVPAADLRGVELEEIQKRQNISITITKGQNTPQIAEFVMGAILASAKQFFHWSSAPLDPKEFWDWPLKDSMWSLKGKTLLQIGLGDVGTMIVQKAKAFGMRTWGVRPQQSFHPDCDKTFPLESLHSILPVSDVVVIALPRGIWKNVIFHEHEFSLMKPDSIFIVVGSADAIDEQALVKVAQTGKFRGVFLDAYRHPPPAKNSPLRTIPSVILTPAASSYPESKEHTAFRIFRYNLRLFIQGRVNEMKNLININTPLLSEK